MVERLDVAVIGAGPAGIAAAIELRRRCVERVAILEREEIAGGVPRHCGHPPFGMREYGRILTGPTYARKLVASARKAGVAILTQHSVVALGERGMLDVATPDGRKQIQPRRVVIATGARETPRAAQLVSGDRPVGVLNTGALQSYIYLKHLLPFRRPVVVGSELVSLSAIATCRSAGVSPVAVIEANVRPTAPWPLALLPRLLGIPVHYCATIVDIRGGGRVESVVIRFADGSRRAVACDGVLFTGRFTPEASLVRSSHVGLDDASDGPAIDQFGRASDPVYFAAGNVLRPIETAGWSFREGRCIGGFVADDLLGRLPGTERSIPVVRGTALKLVVPQRIVLPHLAAGLRDLQIRVSHAVTGRLTVQADGAPIWKRKIAVLPERRILVRFAELPVPDTARTIVVGIEG